MTQLIEGLLLAFALVVILMPPFIRGVEHLDQQRRRPESNSVHGAGIPNARRDVPSLGGLLVACVVAVLAVVFGALDASTYSPLAALAGGAIIGGVKDRLDASGASFRPRLLLAVQVLVALGAAAYVQNHFAITGIRLPIAGDVHIGALPYIFMATLAIVGASHGVRTADGPDGLAAGGLVIAFVAFLIVSRLNVPTQSNLALVCSMLVGALLGFLWFNGHPAHIRLGYSGALGLGGALAIVVLITGQLAILPVVGLVFVVETLASPVSALSQRVGGGRLLRASPLHAHLMLGGWPEEQVSFRLFIVAALSGLLGVTFFLASIAGPAG